MFAKRFANDSDFGETIDDKLAGLWKVLEDLSIRGSIGAGFHAPTPGQPGTTNLSTVFGGGEPIVQGLFPARNPVSAFLGARELKPEQSDNGSLGAIGSFAGFVIMVDLYRIDIAVPFYAVSPITVTPAIRTGTSCCERSVRRHHWPGVVLAERLRFRNLRRRCCRQLRG